MDPKKRIKLQDTSWQTREIVNQVIRSGELRTKTPEGGWSDTWIDQAPFRGAFGDRFFFSCATPYGIFCLYYAYLIRMSSPQAGESKRLIKRDIQADIHLHSKLKSKLLKKIHRAPIRYDGRGLRDLDSKFSEAIRFATSLQEFERIRADIETHSLMPDWMKQNLLLNLNNYSQAS